MKKILFYTDTPNYGGAEMQMELLARRLRPLGYGVSLACGAYSILGQRGSVRSDKSPRVSREDKESVSSANGSSGGSIGQGRSLDSHALARNDSANERDSQAYERTVMLPTIHKHDPRHFLALKKLLRTEKFDLIHIHLWNPGSCRYAFWAAERMGVPIVTTEHDPFELSGIKGAIKKRCLAKTDQIITVSMDNYRQLAEQDENLKNRLNYVPNGIELNRFLDNVDKASLPVQPGDIVLTCIAELHERKGHKYLFQAFEKLRRDMPTLHLVLVGKGPLEDEFKKKYGANPNIHFLGWREDVPALLKATDILVLPSLREAFGLVVIEAMASGVAVVATDNGGTKDIIEHGKSGYLVPPGSADRLEEAIRTLLMNPDQKRDIEQAALKRVKTYFSADVMAKKTADVYEKVIS